MVLNHSFSVDQTSFLVKLLIVFFFPVWLKSSRLKSNSFISFGKIVFRFGSHLLALLVQAGLVKPIRIAASTRYIAAATWLHVSPIPAIHVQWQVLFFAVFSSIIQSLWNGSFIDWDFLQSPLMIQYLLPKRLWYRKSWSHLDLIYSNCMLYYSHSH